MTDRVHHVAVTVSDIGQAISWYQGSFDCELVYQTETEAMLEFSNIKLQLVLPSMLPGHLAFERKDAETFGPLKQNKDGSKSCFISDSTGNPVEIVCCRDVNSKKNGL